MPSSPIEISVIIQFVKLRRTNNTIFYSDMNTVVPPFGAHAGGGGLYQIQLFMFCFLNYHGFMKGVAPGQSGQI